MTAEPKRYRLRFTEEPPAYFIETTHASNYFENGYAELAGSFWCGSADHHHEPTDRTPPV